MSAIEANSGSEQVWRRRCLWGLLILLPAVIAEISYQPVMALLGSEDIISRDVGSGEEVLFGGSNWRLDGMLTTNDTGRARLPANAAPVFVDFSVRVGDPDLQKLWLGCRIRLVDRDERSWLPTYVSILPPSDGQTSCSSAAYSGARAGDTLKIRETFVVPKEALASVRAVLGMSSERPYYLRFDRPAI